MSHVKKSCAEMCTDELQRKVQKTIIPTQLCDLRKIYLEGKNSVIHNLPAPKIYKYEDSHAYVKVQDVIKYFFAFRGEPELLSIIEAKFIKKVSYPTESLGAQEIAKKISHMANSDNKEACVLVTEWHDDFEPNTQSKQNRGSVWILSITILCKKNDVRNSKYYTFPICIGEKNASHEKVLEIYYNDLSDLYKNPITVYDPNAKCERKVRVAKLLSIADSPERRSSNFINRGNGTYSARWGYGINVSEICHPLQSCESCMRDLLHNKYNEFSKKCKQCDNWNFHGNFKITNDYPKEMLKDKDNYCVPCELLSYEGLISCVRTMCKKIADEVWTKKEGKEYLKTFGINDVLIKKSFLQLTKVKTSKTLFL